MYVMPWSYCLLYFKVKRYYESVPNLLFLLHLLARHSLNVCSFLTTPTDRFGHLLWVSLKELMMKSSSVTCFNWFRLSVLSALIDLDFLNSLSNGVCSGAMKLCWFFSLYVTVLDLFHELHIECILLFFFSITEYWVGQLLSLVC